ncbi:MAG: thiamine phosphate synthase [Planctomycetes bacterium]|nr:thiamine phosphate synthase [Planctomycetota bacterium]
MQRDPDADRELLANARLLLLFTPELCGARAPESVLEAVLPEVDVLQLRIKPLGAGRGPELAPADAAGTRRWAERALELRAKLGARTLLFVDDRVDVAALLLDAGLSGVHLGQDDCPAAIAREELGPRAILGWSTHSVEQVLEADELPVDYLGFGPVHATKTKGYERGLGAELAWIASRGTSKPVFPIGGIDRENAQELARIGRAAVSSAILGAVDPVRAARELRALLTPADDER